MVKKVISMLLVILIIAPTSYSLSHSSTEKLDGEQLFRAIFFGQGDAAEIFEHITQPDLIAYEHTDEELDLIKDIVLGIEEEDSTLFNRFETAIYSKDLLQVHEILQEASMHSYNVLEDLGHEVYTTEGGEGEIACVVGPAAVIVAVVHMYVGATHTAAAGFQVGVGAAYWIEVGAWVSDSVNSNLSLEQERVVVDIVEAVN